MSVSREARILWALLALWAIGCLLLLVYGVFDDAW